MPARRPAPGCRTGRLPAGHTGSPHGPARATARTGPNMTIGRIRCRHQTRRLDHQPSRRGRQPALEHAVNTGRRLTLRPGMASAPAAADRLGCGRHRQDHRDPQPGTTQAAAGQRRQPRQRPFPSSTSPCRPPRRRGCRPWSSPGFRHPGHGAGMEPPAGQPSSAQLTDAGRQEADRGCIAPRPVWSGRRLPVCGDVPGRIGRPVRELAT
jgi:hypothetical protein